MGGSEGVTVFFYALAKGKKKESWEAGKKFRHC